MPAHVAFICWRFFGSGSPSTQLRYLLIAILLPSLTQADPYFWNPSPALLNDGGEIQTSANWSVLNNGGGNWPKSSFDDDFTSDALTQWTFQDADSGATTGTFSLTSVSDALTLTGRGADIWRTDNEYVAIWRSDITGNFDVSVKVVSQTGNTSPWSKTGIILANDFTNLAAGGCFAVIATPQNGVKIQFDSLGAIGEFDYPDGTGTGGNTVYPIYLRAAKRGNIYYGYYKQNLNDPWTLIRTGIPQNSTANSKIGLFGTSHNSGMTGTFIFDDFQASGPVLANNFDMVFNGTSTTADSNARLTSPILAQTIDLLNYSGIFSFGSATLTLSGSKANFGTTSTINSGTGTLSFNAPSGIQILTPRAGTLFPAISKSGSGTLQVAGQSLLAGALKISGGALDLGNRSHEFAGLNATAGAITGLSSVDTLIITADANFSGLINMPSAGNVQIKAQSSPAGAKNILFTPGNATFTNLYLWTIGSTFPARITLAPGTLQTKGRLILRDEKGSAGLQGILDFQTYNVNVSADGDIVHIENGSAGLSTQQLLMGSGNWHCKGNVTLAFQNSGTADNSILDLAAVFPTVQTLTFSGGSIANVKHTGTGTLNLGSTLNGKSLLQSVGVLNFNNANVNVTGDLVITNGTSSTLLGLGGRELRAAGNLSLTGQPGNRLNLNPGADWSLFAGGTLNADFASLAKSIVISNPDGNATSACLDEGGNSHWVFAPLTTPPTILTQPLDNTVLTGQKADFTVSVDGAPGFIFEWRRRGNPDFLFSGATLSINPTLASDSGAVYYCTVHNGFGEVVTRDAMLNVNDPAHLLRSPANASVLADNPVTFSISAKGSGALQFKWKKKNDTTITLGTDSIYTLAKAGATLNGTVYFCIVSNKYGQASSGEALLTVNNIPSITSQPRDTAVSSGQIARFSVVATGTADLTYQWYKQGNPTKLLNTAILNLSTVAGEDTARYYCVITNPFGEVTSYAAKLVVGVIPNITMEPSDTSVLVGKAASFKLRASGSTVLGFTWKKVGSPIPLIGDSVLALGNVVAADSGTQYFCIVANGHGSDTSAIVNLRVNRPATIILQPRDTAVATEHAVSFRVTATGSGKLKFSWRKIGDTTTVSSDSILAFNATVLSDSGAKFTCTISNDYGMVVSREAKLSVVQATLITREPSVVSATLGKRAFFSVSAIGVKPMTYAWRRGTDTTSLSTDSTLIIDSVKLSDNGALFSVIVKNGFGADTSLQARLNVIICDSLFKVTPETLTVDEGQPVVLTGRADCAQGRIWSIVKGPAPKILDPAVDNLNFIAPRVTGEVQIIYRFIAEYGKTTISKDVTVKVRDAIPDPLFTLPTTSKWNGSTSFKIKPTLTNPKALESSLYHPSLNYLWFLSVPAADTAQAGDSLVLSNPIQEGLFEVTLCLDNGGTVHCAVFAVNMEMATVGLTGLGKYFSNVILLGNRLVWNKPGYVRITNWQGRILWDARGHAGESLELPMAMLVALRNHRAHFEILP
jgi:autotransporter-associated beta strand protein